MSHLQRLSGALALGALLGTGACAEGPAAVPMGDPTLRIVSGAGSADTIDAVLASPLVVEVRDSRGNAIAGAHVIFQAHRADRTPFAYGIQFVVPAPEYLTARTGVDTDANGRASVRLRLGPAAGSAGLTIQVPASNLARDASYTVRPGAPARLVLAPDDTAVFRGRSARLRSAVSDRAGNPLLDSVSFTVLAGPAFVDGAGLVTTSGYGNIEVVGQVGTGIDTVRVAAVPEGALAASTVHSGLVVMNFDGTARRTIASAGSSPAWSPDGETLIYQADDADGTLVVRSVAGNPRPFLVNDTTRGGHYWPRYSMDGRWVYFFTSAPGEPQEIWRAASDGSGLQRVSPRPSEGFEGHPSPSPDGTRLTYFFDVGNVYIRVRHLASGTASGNLAEGHSPTWSPAGDLIAFNEYPARRRGGILLIRPDGTGLRRLTPASSSYNFGVDWSPDGKWIIAGSTYPALIEVETGMVIRLPALEGVNSDGRCRTRTYDLTDVNRAL
jgi:hypothetical protein